MLIQSVTAVVEQHEAVLSLGVLSALTKESRLALLGYKGLGPAGPNPCNPDVLRGRVRLGGLGPAGPKPSLDGRAQTVLRALKGSSTVGQYRPVCLV